MDTWVWILIAVVAILLIGALVYALTAGRKAKHERELQQQQENREAAARLRDQARESSVSAHETAAGAASARAEADRARLDADQLERRADELEEEAAQRHEHAERHLAEAHEIDPDTQGPLRPDAPDGSPAVQEGTRVKRTEYDPTDAETPEADRGADQERPRG